MFGLWWITTLTDAINGLSRTDKKNRIQLIFSLSGWFSLIRCDWLSTVCQICDYVDENTQPAEDGDRLRQARGTRFFNYLGFRNLEET